MSLQDEHKNTVAELKAMHGNCFQSAFRGFKTGGFVFHYQFTKPVSNRSKDAIKQRFDAFLKRVKLQLNKLEKELW